MTEETIADQPAPVESVSGPLNEREATDAFNTALGLAPEESHAPTEGLPGPVPEQEVVEETDEDGFMLIPRDSEEEQPGDDVDPLEQMIEIAGEQRSGREWREGFMKHADYTQKTQQLAEQRKQVESTLQETTQMREQYAAGLGLITKAAQEDVSMFDGVDWARMAQENPNDYVKYRAAYDQATQKLQSVENEAVGFFQQVDQETKKHIKSNAIRCVQQLKNQFKNWDNNTYYGLVEFGMNQGIEKNSLLNCTDPGVFQVLHKAYMYDKGKNIKTNRKASASPSRTSPGRNERGQFSKKDTSMDRLKETGHRDYATAAFAKLLGG